MVPWERAREGGGRAWPSHLPPQRVLVCPSLSSGSGEQAPTLVHVYLLVILGTVFGALLLGYLFKR